jgi:hypothetical protein
VNACALFVAQPTFGTVDAEWLVCVGDHFQKRRKYIRVGSCKNIHVFEGFENDPPTQTRVLDGFLGHWCSQYGCVRLPRDGMK